IESFFSSRRRRTRFSRDWSSDVCSADLLASPDTLAVNAGAHVVLVLVAVLGIAVPFYLGGLLATVGGLAGALLVLLLARGGADRSEERRVGKRSVGERDDDFYH